MAKERPSTDETVAKNLRRLMALKEWSQSELARKSGVSQTHIGGILRGESGCTIPMADALAKPFGITGWHLIMPNLPDDLVHSDHIRSLVEAYINATPEGREFLDAAADRERKRKNK